MGTPRRQATGKLWPLVVVGLVLLGLAIALGRWPGWGTFPTGDRATADTARRELRIVRVPDGDSLEGVMAEAAGPRQPVTVRLAGIDCPEWNQPFGREAALFTRRHAEGQVVSLDVVGRDRYGRLLGEVTLPDGSLLGRRLVGAGLAWWYRRHTEDAELERLEDEARRAGRGLWGDSRPIPPWEWRKKHPAR